MRASIQVRLHLPRQIQIHTSIPRMNIPRRSHRRPLARPRGHAAIPRPDTQRIESPFHIDVPIARGNLRPAIQRAPLNMPVARVQPDIPLRSLHRDMPIARPPIQISINRIRLHRPIPRTHLQVRVLRHVHFHPQARVPHSKVKPISAMRFRNHFHRIPILRSANLQIPIQLVPGIFDPNLHLLDISRGHPHRPIIRLHPHMSVPRHSKSLRHLICEHPARDQHHPPTQQSPNQYHSSHPYPHRSRQHRHLPLRSHPHKLASATRPLSRNAFPPQNVPCEFPDFSRLSCRTQVLERVPFTPLANGRLLHTNATHSSFSLFSAISVPPRSAVPLLLLLSRLPLTPRLLPQLPQKLLRRQRIHYILLLQPP